MSRTRIVLDTSLIMLRRVISRMKPEDAMETLLAQMSRTETTDEFLKMLSVES